MIEDATSKALRPADLHTAVDRQTAIHEAGHAVVAHSFGWRLRLASIVPRHDGANGYVAMDRPIVRATRSQGRRVREMRQIQSELVCILLAGQTAVRRLWGDAAPMGMAEGDYQASISLLSLLATDAPQQALMWSALEAEAEGRLGRQWDTVVALADELQRRRTLSGRSVTAFLRKADARRATLARELSVPLSAEEIDHYGSSLRQQLLCLLPPYVAAAFPVPSREFRA